MFLNGLVLGLECKDTELGLHRLTIRPQGITARDMLVKGVHPNGYLTQSSGVAPCAKIMLDILNEPHNILDTPYGQTAMGERIGSYNRRYGRYGGHTPSADQEEQSASATAFLQKVIKRVCFVDDSWDYFAEIYPKIFARFVGMWDNELAHSAIQHVSMSFDAQRALLKKNDPDIVVRSFGDISDMRDLHKVLKPEDIIEQQAFVTEKVLGPNISIRRKAAVEELVDDKQRLCLAPNGFPMVTGSFGEGSDSISLDFKRIPSTPDVYDVFPQIDIGDKRRSEAKTFRKNLLSYTGVPTGLQPTGPYNLRINVDALDILRNLKMCIRMSHNIYVRSPTSVSKGKVRTESVQTLSTSFQVCRSDYVGRTFRLLFKELGIRIGGSVDDQGERLLEWLTDFYKVVEPVIHRTMKKNKYILYNGQVNHNDQQGMMEEVFSGERPRKLEAFKKLCGLGGMHGVQVPPPEYSWRESPDVCMSRFAKQAVGSCLYVYIEKHMRGEVVFDTTFTNDVVSDEQVIRSLYFGSKGTQKLLLKVRK